MQRANSLQDSSLPDFGFQDPQPMEELMLASWWGRKGVPWRETRRMMVMTMMVKRRMRCQVPIWGLLEILAHLMLITFCEEGSVSVSILWVRKLKPREVEAVIQGNWAHMWQSQSLSP